ncbi:MAG: ComEC/Rec2 family competence protein, partial [Candidatus Krumholzibacteria bacterium]|nr:ComEC/Rec2 family competence protein [Candidatus Krumholzibacteria bacterium]
MVLWWSAFFIVGVIYPPEPRYQIAAVILVSLLFVISLSERTLCAGTSEAVTLSHGQRIRERFILICSTAVIIWMGAGLAVETRNPGAIDRNGSTWASGDYKSITVDRIDVHGREIESRKAKRSWAIIGRVRGRLIDSLDDDLLSLRSKELLRALLLAYRQGLDRELRDVYEYLGIAHFLALSGLHLGIIALPVAYLLFVVRLSRVWRDTALLVILFLYSAVAGFPPSLLRALALTGALIIHRALGIRIELLRSLVMGCFILAAVDFSVVLGTGFRLSFIAVCGIALIGIPIVGRVNSILPAGIFGRISRLFIFPLLITCSIQLFSLPLILSLFKRSSLLAPIINLIVVLPVTFLLYCGALYLLAPFHALRAALAVPVNFLSDFLWEVPSYFSHGPHPALYSGDINPVAHAAGLVMLSLSLRKSCPRRYVILAAALSFFLISFQASRSSRRNMNSAFPSKCSFEVVHVSRWSGNRSFFSPVGNGVLFLEGPVSRYEARSIVKALWGKGKNKLGCLIVGQGKTGNG